MSNIITSTVEGVEFDPDSLADEEAPVIDLKTAIRDLDALLAENEEVPKVVASKLEPCFLHLSYPDKSNTYYFKCNLLSIVAGTVHREIEIEAAQSQLLKLFSYWQNSFVLNNNRHVLNKHGKYANFSKLLRKKRHAQEQEPKAHLMRIYTYVDGIKRNLLELNGPNRITEIQYLVNENKPTLKICI